MPQPDTIGLYGDFWTRFLLMLLRLFPAWFCVAATWPLAIIFYCLAAPQRRVVMANLRGLRPKSSGFALWWGGCRVFAQFALTYMDRLWSQHLRKPICPQFRDRDELIEQLAKPGGVLLFTTHSGNYDIGAELFAQAFTRPIHVVRIPERTKGLQQFRAAELSASESRNSNLRIHYVRDEWSLGLELCRLLESGEGVAVQGDRGVPGSAQTVIEHEGMLFRLPRGPLILAAISKVPCYAVFITRAARCVYEFRSAPAFYKGGAACTDEDIGRAWLTQMAPFVREHWDQWYIFDEPVVGAFEAELPACDSRLQTGATDSFARARNVFEASSR